MDKKYILKLLEPGDKPCDCIEDHNGYWIQNCDCQNSGDLAEVAEWCALANRYNTVKKELEK